MNHAEPERKVRFSVMYTAQTRRKKKIWHDGEAIYLESKRKLILKDDRNTTLAGHWVYREPHQGEEIAFDGYLVQIDSKEEEMEGSQEPIVLRVAPVEPSVQQDTPELQQLLNKWKHGKLFPEKRTQPEKPAQPAQRQPSVPTSGPAYPASSFDAVGDLVRWNGPTELPHNNGDSVFDLAGFSADPEPVAPKNVPIVSLLDSESEYPSSGQLPSQIDFSSQLAHIESSQPLRSGPGLPASSSDSPLPPQSTPFSPAQPAAPGQPLAHLLQDSNIPSSHIPGSHIPSSRIPSSPVPEPAPSSPIPSSPGSPVATQDDPEPQNPISRQSGPSLESLLAPTNRLQQGLHGLQRESFHRDTLSLQDSFKTAGQIEADERPKKNDDWIKRIPKETPETGRWTWEGYWLVDYQA